jgi:hypothetical protein
VVAVAIEAADQLGDFGSTAPGPDFELVARTAHFPVRAYPDTNQPSQAEAVDAAFS